MRFSLLSAAVVVSTALSGAAFAANSTTTGTIKSLDLAKHMLTLDSGTVYQLPATFKDPGLKVGEKVAIVWDMKGTTHEASEVTIVK